MFDQHTRRVHVNEDGSTTVTLNDQATTFPASYPADQLAAEISKIFAPSYGVKIRAGRLAQGWREFWRPH